MPADASLTTSGVFLMTVWDFWLFSDVRLTTCDDMWRHVITGDDRLALWRNKKGGNQLPP
jgi:hypothetical protein